MQPPINEVITAIDKTTNVLFSFFNFSALALLSKKALFVVCSLSLLVELVGNL